MCWHWEVEYVYSYFAIPYATADPIYDRWVFFSLSLSLLFQNSKKCARVDFYWFLYLSISLLAFCLSVCRSVGESVSICEFVFTHSQSRWFKFTLSFFRCKIILFNISVYVSNDAHGFTFTRLQNRCGQYKSEQKPLLSNYRNK